jgi:hypothetical protein
MLDRDPRTWNNKEGGFYMKKVLAVAVFLILAGSLYGQSVAELSRREKARREGLKGNRARVVTNFDLAAVRKTPAIFSPSLDYSTDQNAPAVVAPEASVGTAQGTGDASEPVVMVPTVVSDGPTLYGEGAAPGPPTTEKDLESQIKASDELIELLTNKINVLLQEANNLNTMTPRDVIMQQIDEASQKLTKTQDDAAKLRSQLDAARKNQPGKR